MAFDIPTRLGADKCYWSSSSAAGLSIAAENVEIAGFDFVATSSYPGIEFAATHWNCAVHDCQFGRRGALQDGIKIAAGIDAPYMSVYDNLFSSGIVRDGVRFEGAATYGWFGIPGHGNVFNVTLIGIDSTSTTVLGGIADNVFRLPSDTEGYAISFTNSGSSGCMIDGNKAFYGNDTMITNPYRDVGSNHWGLNYRQGLSILPEIA